MIEKFVIVLIMIFTTHGCSNPETAHDSLDDTVRRNLNSGSEAARILAVRKLSHSTIPERRELLIHAVIADSPDVQLEAIQALAEFDDGSAAPAYLRALDSPDSRVQMAAAKALILFGDTIVDNLTGGLAAVNSSQLRSWCAALLGELRAQASLPGLEAMLMDQEDRAAIAALHALSKFGEPGFKIIANHFLELPYRVRSYAALVLAEYYPASFQAIIRTLPTADTQTVVACLEALPRADIPEREAIILTYLASQSPILRRTAVIAALSSPSDSYDTMLTSIANSDPDPMIKMMAVTKIFTPIPEPPHELWPLPDSQPQSPEPSTEMSYE